MMTQSSNVTIESVMHQSSEILAYRQMTTLIDQNILGSILCFFTLKINMLIFITYFVDFSKKYIFWSTLIHGFWINFFFIKIYKLCLLIGAVPINVKKIVLWYTSSDSYGLVGSIKSMKICSPQIKSILQYVDTVITWIIISVLKIIWPPPPFKCPSS